MSEQARVVSGGLSLQLTPVKPGRAEPVVGGDAAVGNVTAFSKELDQALQQQHGKTRAEPAQPESRKAGSQSPATRLDITTPLANQVQVIRLAEEPFSHDSTVEEPAAVSFTGAPMPTESIETTEPLLTVASQSLNGEMHQNTAMPSYARNALPATATSPDAGSGVRAADSEAINMPHQQGAASTAMVSNTAPAIISPAPIAEPRNRTLGSTVTQGTPVLEPTQRPTTAIEKNTGTLNGNTREIVTQGTLAGRSRQLGNDVGDMTGMASSPRPIKWSGESAGLARRAPEPVTTEPVVKSNPAQVNVTDPGQLTSGSAVVTLASLAGRLRQQDNGAPTSRAPATVTSGMLQTGPTVLNTSGADRLPVSEASLSNSDLSNSGLSELDSFNGVIDVNKAVQQRIATTEMMLAQMATEAGNTVIKAPTADNMLLAMSSGTVAAPVVQPTDSMAGPVVQAPLNISLTSTNAETALAGNVKWMTNEGVKNAVMTVTPHGMGTISVKIGIENNQMDVSIIASQATTRDALESMLPRLREQLAIQGHESVKVDVSDGKSDQSRSGNGHTSAESRNPAGASPQDEQSNSGMNGEKAERGGSGQTEVDAESFMAEDLQRVAARVVGEVDGRPVFDVYV